MTEPLENQDAEVRRETAGNWTVEPGSQTPVAGNGTADAGSQSATAGSLADAAGSRTVDPSRPRRLQTPAEERFNLLSHAILAGLLVLSLPLSLYHIQTTAGSKAVVRTVSVLIYLLCILTMLVSSSAYHALPQGSRWKRITNRIDHISIYLAIAGSYTPVALGALDRAAAIRVLLAEWGLTIIGIIFKLRRFRTGRANAIFSTILYLAMGWLIAPYVSQLVRNVSPAFIAALFAGGIAYTAGVIFYSIQKPRMHNVWHVCVAIGVICHFTGIVLFL